MPGQCRAQDPRFKQVTITNRRGFKQKVNRLRAKYTQQKSRAKEPFMSWDPPKGHNKSGQMGTGKKAALAVAGTAAVGGGGYGLYRLAKSKRGITGETPTPPTPPQAQVESQRRKVRRKASTTPDTTPSEPMDAEQQAAETQADMQRTAAAGVAANLGARTRQDAEEAGAVTTQGGAKKRKVTDGKAAEQQRRAQTVRPHERERIRRLPERKQRRRVGNPRYKQMRVRNKRGMMQSVYVLRKRK